MLYGSTISYDLSFLQQLHVINYDIEDEEDFCIDSKVSCEGLILFAELWASVDFNQIKVIKMAGLINGQCL